MALGDIVKFDPCRSNASPRGYDERVARVVQLRQGWTLGKQIGDRSGFGRVFLAVAEDGTQGVVKLIRKQPGADRELLFEDLAGVRNVVPIIDSGETRRDWALAMPRADRSLRAELEKAGGQLEIQEGLTVLSDVAGALAEIDGRVVHRDVKPENVLLLGGAWSLADFGLARYAEASTGPVTWKDVFTAAYAAPEQWHSEHATGATDVYAFGVMAFELLAGKRPFPGPNREDHRHQHLTEDAPPVTGVPPLLAALITECMYKVGGARPTPANVLRRLQMAQQPSSPAAARLQAANQLVQAERSAEFARASAARTAEEGRLALFEASRKSLEAIAGQLRQSVLDNAPASTPTAGTPFDEWAIQLGGATIGMDPATLSDASSWKSWRPVFDVIAFATVGVLIPPDRHAYAGRAHSLLYCDAQKEGVYRWFETAFMVSPLMSTRTAMDPVALPPGEFAGKALSRTLAEWQVAWPFTPIDQGQETEFIERWLGSFGQAAEGQLSHPSSMPELPPGGTYRN